MTANPKIRANSEKALRSSGPKTQSGPKRLIARRDELNPTKKKPIIVNVPLDGTGTRPGRLRGVGGSASDTFNNIIANQAVNSLWRAHSDKDETAKQCEATVAAMIGITPKDELEGMLAAQMVAAHNAAMECFRRAMFAEQTIEGWRENLNQANKLMHSYTTLIEALDRHRGFPEPYPRPPRG